MSDHAQDLRLVEAIVFASTAPVEEGKLAERLPEGADVPGLLAELAELYRPRGINLVRVGGGWTMRTAPDLAPRLLLERTVTRKLSRAAVETLAIVAYHQPVTRGEIEEIRGVVIGKGTLDTLMEAGWIQPKGRRETPGRPVTWVTTEAFLSHFGLDSLSDLPGVEELKAAGLLDARPATSLGESAELEQPAETADADAEDGEAPEEGAEPEADEAQSELETAEIVVEEEREAALEQPAETHAADAEDGEAPEEGVESEADEAQAELETAEIVGEEERKAAPEPEAAPGEDNAAPHDPERRGH